MAKRIKIKEIIVTEIEKIPDPLLEEVLDFIHFLNAKQMQGKKQVAELSESSLKKDWLKPKEDKVWQNL